MGVGKSKEPPAIELVATGTVSAETLRLLLECAGMGRVTAYDPSTGWTASHSDGGQFGVTVGSSMMKLPADDAKLYMLSLERPAHPCLHVDGYSLLAPAPDNAMQKRLMERKALLFVVDAAAATALATEKEQLHELLGRMSGRPPIVLVIALNSKQGCSPLPGKDGGCLSDEVRLRLGLDDLTSGGAVVHLLDMSSEEFPDSSVILEAFEWVGEQLLEQL